MYHRLHQACSHLRGQVLNRAEQQLVYFAEPVVRRSDFAAEEGHIAVCLNLVQKHAKSLCRGNSYDRIMNTSYVRARKIPSPAMCFSRLYLVKPLIMFDGCIIFFFGIVIAQLVSRCSAWRSAGEGGYGYPHHGVKSIW